MRHFHCRKASLDGYIANDDASFSWLNTNDSYEGIATEPDEAAILNSIDCYVIGARTYETALRLGWPYGDKPTYVLSHNDLVSDRGSVNFHSGDLTAFINELKLRPTAVAWCRCGTRSGNKTQYCHAYENLANTER